MADSLKALRQSTAELLACALCDLFPDTQLVTSSISDIGFHYDVVLSQPLDPFAIRMIEERMHAIANSDREIRTFEMMLPNAISYFQHHHQDIKSLFLSTLPDPIVRVFQMGDFIDVCTEPTLESMKGIKAFRLFSTEELTSSLPDIGEVAITRFHGTVFEDSSALKKFLKRAATAKNRDHVTAGKAMQLFTRSHELGCWLWSDNGTLLRNLLWNLCQEIQKSQKIVSIYSDSNDPSSDHAAIFQSFSSSQLPMRYSSRTTLINSISPTQYHGLFETYSYEKEITTIFCSKDQVVKELISSLHFFEKIIKIFGFEHQWYLLLQRPRGMKGRDQWNQCIEVLQSALMSHGLHSVLDKEGETRYGPRVEVRIADALGRFWPTGYVALDAMHPAAKELQYREDDGTLHQPTMISRSIFGPIERFIAVLIEQLTTQGVSLQAFLEKIKEASTRPNIY